MSSYGISNLISTCQQKYTEISSVEIKDHYYLIATVVSAAAVTAFQLYAPITCGICTVVLTGLNVHHFGKALSQASVEESSHLKNWMMVSCLVTSSVFGVYAIRSLLPLFVSGMESLLTLETPYSVFCFTIATGILGFGLPNVKAIYERGLELSKTDKWEAMENYLSNKLAKPMSLRDKVALFILIMMPKLATTSYFSNYLKSGFYFLPEAEQDSIFESLLKLTESTNTLQYFQYALQPFFLSLSNSLQAKYYPHLVNLHENHGDTLFTSDFNAKLSNDLTSSYMNKRQEIQTQYEALLSMSKEQLAEMTKKINKVVEPTKGKPLSEDDSANLNTLKEQGVSLREKLKNFVADCELYCPTLSLFDYKKFYTELLSGPFQKQLQKLISKQANAVNQDGAEQLDLEETIGNYIMMNYANEDRLGGMKLFAEVATRFGVGPQDMDGLENALKPLGIETVGKFIDVIFSGNKEDLSSSKLVLEKLDAYLKAQEESKNSFRARMYTALSGSILRANINLNSSQMITIASKVTYRAVMILSTMAPIISQPSVFAVTFAGTVVWNLTYSVAGHLIPAKVQSFWNEISQADQLKGIKAVIRLASRRPFLNLFSRLDHIDHAYEMYTYLGADFLAKMRILSAELFYGTIVSYFSIGQYPNTVRIAGLLTGIAVGNEATDLIQKAWKKLSPAT